MTTYAEVPDYENPVFRFLEGVASLKEVKSGAAFTIWEALIHFRDEQYPLNVRGKSFTKVELLVRAADILENGDVTVARLAIGEDELKRIRKECVAAGLIHS
ncbi:MAG: hypothetical protein ACRD38_02900 [Nitrososphaerales archaeon]